MSPRSQPLLLALVAAALVLVSAAWLRSAEYDEQYTLFLTGGTARPIWPADAFAAGEVQRLQAGHAGLVAIARDLRSTDVHPPLYFWTVAAWRTLVGDSLFAARLASVLFSLASLSLVAAIARLAGIPPATAVLLTAGCYGFVYTGTIARGFALAELLTLAGVALALRAERHASGPLALGAGAAFGAATFANYLAAFVAVAAVLWLAHALLVGRPRATGDDAVNAPGARHHNGLSLLAMIVGITVWLLADLWFFLAQRESRRGQFDAFDTATATVRLARYLAANLSGGLPLYVGGAASHIVAIALSALLVILTALVIRQWPRIAAPGPRLLLAMAAAAPPVGLLLLSLLTDSTPIELRYLAFATPFIGLLLAGTFASLPRNTGRVFCCLVLVIQGLSLAGLITRQETMQSARATAADASSLVGDGVVLVPKGNDGVGIVGAFAIESPPALRLLVVGRDASPAQIRARSGGFPRVVLALLGQDGNSRATLPIMRQAFVDPCWREVGEGFNVIAFARICE